MDLLLDHGLHNFSGVLRIGIVASIFRNQRGVNILRLMGDGM
jgi:hypothetical protein